MAWCSSAASTATSTHSARTDRSAGTTATDQIKQSASTDFLHCALIIDAAKLRAPLSLAMESAMTRPSIKPLIFAIAAGVWCAAHAAPATDVPTRVKALNDLLAEQWEYQLKESPEFATILGDYRYNDKFSDFTIAHAQQQKKDAQAFIARFEAIDTTGFAEQDRLNQQLMVRQLKDGIRSTDLKLIEMPVDQFNGVHLLLAQFVSALPFDSTKHYEDYLARLNQVPRVFDQLIDVLKQGEKDKLMPPRFLLEKVVTQCQSIAEPAGEASVFGQPVAKFADGVAAKPIASACTTRSSPRSTARCARPTEARRLHRQGLRAEGSHRAGPVGAAERRCAVSLRRRAADHDEQVARGDPPARPGRGQAHRRRAVEDRDAARLQGPGRACAPRSTRIRRRTRPRASRSWICIKSTSRRCSRSCRSCSACCRRPRSKCCRSRSSARRKPAARSTTRARRTASARAASTSTPAISPTARLLNIETTAYHEGVPGHHMQISIAQTLPGLPPFRQQGGYNAYAEGWALYSERLGKEVGFFQDPLSYYGHLSDELLRAEPPRARHRRALQALDAPADGRLLPCAFLGRTNREVQSETDRYIAYPGQALSYKIGQLKIPRTARTREEGTRRQVRHPRVPRRDAERRRAAARRARGAHECVDCCGEERSERRRESEGASGE